MRVLVVEDDIDVSDAIRRALSLDSHRAEVVADGRQVLSVLTQEDFDVVILDIGLPTTDGLEVLRRIRGAGNQVPILLLTARDLTSDRVAGLDAGADDYLTKPFEIDELNARLRALSRRKRGRAASILSCGDVTLDPSSRVVQINGQVLDISGREYTILLELMEHGGQVVTRESLMAAIYGWEAQAIGSNTVDVHVSHLRGKLGAQYIRTIRGVGFVFDDRSA